MKTHTCDFRFVKYYWIGRNSRVKWVLSRCYYPGCGEERREKAER